MGGPCELVCETDDARLARRLGEYARTEAQRIDRKFSRHAAGSVVDTIHASQGKRVRVDDETARFFDYGAALWRLSAGRFDLTSGLLRNAWHFDERPGRVDCERIPGLLKRVGWRLVGWIPPEITVPEGMEIDFGDISKEYAVDRVADWVTRQTECPVLVNLGGALRCTGAPPSIGAWQVDVESIEPSGKSATYVELKSGALATSGDAQRHIKIDGKRYGRIFDARTGWPVPDAPRAITVAAPSCSQAGSYSTLAILKGADAENFLDREGVHYWCLR